MNEALAQVGERLQHKLEDVQHGREDALDHLEDGLHEVVDAGCDAHCDGGAWGTLLAGAVKGHLIILEYGRRDRGNQVARGRVRQGREIERGGVCVSVGLGQVMPTALSTYVVSAHPSTFMFRIQVLFLLGPPSKPEFLTRKRSGHSIQQAVFPWRRAQIRLR